MEIEGVEEENRKDGVGLSRSRVIGSPLLVLLIVEDS
jgi:hypothetical protein